MIKQLLQFVTIFGKKNLSNFQNGRFEEIKNFWYVVFGFKKFFWNNFLKCVDNPNIFFHGTILYSILIAITIFFRDTHMVACFFQSQSDLGPSSEMGALSFTRIGVLWGHVDSIISRRAWRTCDEVQILWAMLQGHSGRTVISTTPHYALVM